MYTDNFCSTNINRGDLESIVDHCSDQGFRIFDPFADFAFCEGDAYISSLQIYPDLTLDKCTHNYGASTVGYIAEDGSMVLDEAQLANWCVNSPFEDEQCSKCISLPLCFGGCPKTFAEEGRRNCFYLKDFDIFKQIQRYE